MSLAIDARGLTKRFGAKPAVDRLDLRVPTGTVHGLLGTNGAGKSTTVRMLTTLIAPSSGTATVAGFDVVRDPMGVRSRIALVGDQGGADSLRAWTGEEYVRHFARLRGLPDPKAAARRALQSMGCSPDWTRRVLGSYSTGMRRRVEIARGLVSRPQVLFLDEPTRGLDLVGKRELWASLQRLAEGGMTVLLSSHETDEVRALCGRVSVISAGRLTYDGAVDGLGQDAEAFGDNLARLLATAPKSFAATPKASFRPTR